MSSNEPATADIRAAQVANLLARGVRDNEIVASDALRIIRHELRRRNTNKKLTIEVRSVGAQTVIDAHGPNAPKNGSDDALHADHVYPITEETLHQVDSLDRWLEELVRARTVVCVTARENYDLEVVERRGITGPAKYEEAGVTFTTDRLPWLGSS